MLNAACFLMGISLTLCGVFAVMMWKESGEEEQDEKITVEDDEYFYELTFKRVKK